jgi:hypothetical protein
MARPPSSFCPPSSGTGGAFNVGQVGKTSTAANLVARDTNDNADAFRFDRSSQAVVAVREGSFRMLRRTSSPTLCLPWQAAPTSGCIPMPGWPPCLPGPAPSRVGWTCIGCPRQLPDLTKPGDHSRHQPFLANAGSFMHQEHRYPFLPEPRLRGQEPKNLRRACSWVPGQPQATLRSSQNRHDGE